MVSDTLIKCLISIGYTPTLTVPSTWNRFSMQGRVPGCSGNVAELKKGTDLAIHIWYCFNKQSCVIILYGNCDTDAQLYQRHPAVLLELHFMPDDDLIKMLIEKTEQIYIEKYRKDIYLPT